MNDNQLTKYQLIENGTFSIYKKERYILHKLKMNVDNQEEYIENDLNPIFRDNFDTCKKMYYSIAKRKNKVFKKLIQWSYYVSNNNSYKLVFGTLTFRDDVLQSTTKTTRRRYVSRYLNDYTLHYIANIDFGKKNGREHYHFIALVEKNIPKFSWNYGGCNFKGIKSSVSLRNRKNYLLKLTNHTFKDSTKQEKILSDRSSYNSIVAFICNDKDSFSKFRDNFYLELYDKKEQ